LNQPTPFDVTVRALQEYAMSAPLEEMVGAVEALRLMRERPNKAAALFAPETKSLPPTDKQVSLLKRLGHSGRISNREEASTEIQKRLGTQKQKQVKQARQKEAVR
jgi:hypothetical protein